MDNRMPDPRKDPYLSPTRIWRLLRHTTGVWPVIAVTALGCTMCAAHVFRLATWNPSVRWTQKDDSTVLPEDKFRHVQHRYFKDPHRSMDAWEKAAPKY